MADEKDTKVTDGGLHIADFEDLKLAFLDLLDKHNKLAISHSELLRDLKDNRPL